MPENCENSINNLDCLSIEEKEALLKAVAQRAISKESRKQKFKTLAFIVFAAALISGAFFLPQIWLMRYIFAIGIGFMLWIVKKYVPHSISNAETQTSETTMPPPEKFPELPMTEDELTIASIHEAGHAVCCHFLPGIQEMKKIQIGGLGEKNLGGAVFFKDASTHLVRESVFKNIIAGRLGGVIAEKIVLEESSCGSEHDLIAASAIARDMVTLLGMGKRIGLCSLAELQSFFREDLETDIRDILNECQQLCEKTLTEHREILEKLAAELRNKKSLDEEEIKAFFAREAPPDESETDDDDECI